MKLGATLDQTLSPGIYHEVSGKPIPSFPRYDEEIASFNGKGLGLPFVNQTKALTELSSKISSEYPYACLVGEPGIGKTMIIDYVTRNMVNENGLKTIKEQVPELEPTFRIIRDRASRFTHRDYILLPNLKDAMEVDALDYTDSEQAEKDIRVATSFFDDINTVLGNYARDNRTNIRLELTEKEFRSQARSRTSDIYASLYDRVCELTTPEKHARKKNTQQQDFAIATFSLPDKLDHPDKIKTSYKFVTKEGDNKPNITRYKPLAKKTGRNESLKSIEAGLASNLVFDHVKPLVLNLLWDLNLTDAKKKGGEFYTTKEAFEIFKEEFDKYVSDVITPMETSYKGGTILNQRQMLSNIRTSETRSAHSTRISPKTIDDIVNKLRGLREKYTTEMCSPALHKRLDDYVAFFDRERAIVEKSLKKMHNEIREIERKDPPEVKVKGKKRKEDDKKEEDDRKKDYEKVKFQLSHGKFDMEIENIMKVNSFRDSSATGGVTITEIRDFSKDNLYGTFIDHNQETPPHMTYKTLGDFFRGGILTFPDCFSDFIKSIVGGGLEKKYGSKEVYLSFFQNQVMPVTNEGVCFKFKAPRIIIGSDNEDPFVTNDGFFTSDQPGLRDRIKLIPVDYYIDNSADARSGTISVINDSLKRFTDSRAITNGDLSLSSEAKEMLVQSTLLDEHVGLVLYRGLSKTIDDICDFAIRKNSKEITPDLLRNRIRETLPEAYFYSVDRKANEWDGWFNWQKSEVGSVIGLSAGGHRVDNLIKVQSYFVRDKDPLPRDKQRFEFSDAESDLVDQTAIKGFDLATDWMKNFIYDARDKSELNIDEGWKVKTQWQGNWYQSGGPSASLAITSSIISALSKQPIFRNRFMTGTIDASTGDAGIIGGTYMKGLIPTRIHDLMPEEQQREEPIYFLFPAPNLKDLTQRLIFDPFDMGGKIIALPIRNIADAYHLLTCGPIITKEHWDSIDELGPKALEEAKEKIKNPDNVE